MKRLNILLCIIIFVMIVVMIMANEEYHEMCHHIEELEKRIQLQAELIDLQGKDSRQNFELRAENEKLREEKAHFLAHAEELTALRPLREALPLTEIIQFLDELPRVNLFEAPWQITANFGESVGYHGRLRSVHEGIDLITSGMLAHAYAGGTVVDIGWDQKYGKHLTIQHSPNVRTFYAHAGTIFYSADLGKEVTAGQPILRIGNTGQVYSLIGNDGTHLHFELQIKVGETWVPINPRPWLSKEVTNEKD